MSDFDLSELSSLESDIEITDSNLDSDIEHKAKRFKALSEYASHQRDDSNFGYYEVDLLYVLKFNRNELKSGYSQKDLTRRNCE